MASRLAVQAAAGAKQEGLFGGKARQFYLEVSPCMNPACSLAMPQTAVAVGPLHLLGSRWCHQQQLRQLQGLGVTQLLQQMPHHLLPYPGSALSYLPHDYVVA